MRLMSFDLQTQWAERAWRSLAVSVVSAAAAVSILADQANAQAPAKMNSEIHTVVIEKLEMSLAKVKADETISLVPVRARLADLYADRARLRAMEEAEQNCTTCKGATDDRRRALALYERVVVDAEQSMRGPLLVQMSHLYEIQGEPKKAQAIYQRLIREGTRKHEDKIVAAGYIGRAEGHFSRGRLSQAQSDFESALKLAPATKRGPITHRIAWCQLNKGEQPQAVSTLKRVLTTPALLLRDSTSGPVLDESFQEDVARDLATFMARGNVSERDVAMMENLAPERAKKDILKHFASETDRLGQKQASILAWGVYTKYETEKNERLLVMVRVAQLRFELGDKAQAHQEMKEAITFWNQSGCDAAEICEQAKGRLRKIVLDWHRSEKKDPSIALLAVYGTYLAKFDDDVEMTHWAAGIAQHNKRHEEAANLYHKSSLLAYAQLGREKDAKKLKDLKNLLESSVVGRIEMAELTKNKDLREAAYDHYLKLNPNGAIASKVRYQRARIAYERGDSREASRRFNAYVTGSDCRGGGKGETEKFCTQAADLDLDSLVLLKDHATVEQRAIEYAGIIRSRQVEYFKISRTAVLKQVENAEPRYALTKLSRANMTGADAEERIRFAKTRMVLGEKARELGETAKAARDLLAIKGISASDRELALGRLAWVAEMNLDFAEAYKITRKLEMRGVREDEKALKLALLAELAGRPYRKHEEEFLSLSKNRSRKAIMMAKMVRDARNPLREFERHQNELRSFPALYAPLALEVFARSGNIKFAERMVRDRRIMAEPAGRAIAAQIFIRDFASLDRTIRRHRLRSQSDALIQRTLGERLNLIANAEKMANRAISTKDLSLQVIVLSSLSRENKRLHDEILALPMPSRLRGKDRAAYQAAIAANAAGYLAKHQQIETKLVELWSDREATREVAETYRTAGPNTRPLAAILMRNLINVAPTGIRAQLESELKSAPSVASSAQVAKAFRSVQEKPFHTGRIQKLRDVESSRGRETMVAYLDARLTTLKEGEKQ